MDVAEYEEVDAVLCTCVRRKTRRGPLRREGLRAVGQQWVEMGHVRVLHHRHVIRLQI